MDNIAEELKNRTKKFAIDIVKLCRTFPKEEESVIIKRQIIRSATSTAANYRAVCRGRSDAEFFSKLSIVVEESDETLFWLELITELELVNNAQLKHCFDEASQLIKIFSKSRKTAKANRYN
ncbi:MAG TPA: four helix bundle protein [Bacteroidia bacterium]|jgi:four helix bundle protein|nr:four helix bundle protein [Bacteroidia bacterium]